MKVSNINIQLTQNDLFSIIEDVVEKYAKIEELKINKLTIDKNIIIQGVYTWKFNLDFRVELGIVDVINNIIILKLEKVKVFNIGVFSGIVGVIEKKIINLFKYLGIGYKNKEIRIDLKVINQLIPMVDFKVISIILENEKLFCDISDLKVDNNKAVVTVEELKRNYELVNTMDYKNINKETEECNLIKINNKSKKDLKLDDIVEENEIESKDITMNKEISVSKKESKDSSDLGKSRDGYTDIRKNIKKSVPSKYKKILEYALLIPDLIALMVRLFKDKRVAIKTKLLIGAAIAYVSLPIDIIPDTIPFIGKIDDITIIFFVLDKLINEVPKEIILEHWQGKGNIILVISEAIEYLTIVIGLDNTRKVLKVVKSLFKIKGRSKKELRGKKRKVKNFKSIT
ncbi:MAG: DUF1232 domain-containing protein [Clostridium sp.]